MAESQHPFPYTPDDIASLKGSLSTARFATYLARAGNDEAYALELYLYNARLAEAFLYPLNVVEVTLRNAIDESLGAVYGPYWPYDNHFRNKVLTSDGLSTLNKAIGRAGGAGASRNQVVATLTFDFWSNFFRPEYGSFWRTKLNIVLPRLPRSVSRHDIQTAVKEINQFRNRIAHHEPILDLNATDVMAKIKMVVQYRCQRTFLWMRHYNTVDLAMRSFPDAHSYSGEKLSSRQDQQLVLVSGREKIADVLAQVAGTKCAIVRVDSAGVPTGACTVDQIVSAIAAEALKIELNGLVSLREIEINAVLGAVGPASHWEVLADCEPMALAVQILQKPKIKILIGVDASSRRATGAVVRAHRRY